MTLALVERLAPGSAYLFFNESEFALSLRVRIVEGLCGRVTRRFANG